LRTKRRYAHDLALIRKAIVRLSVANIGRRVRRGATPLRKQKKTFADFDRVRMVRSTSRQTRENGKRLDLTIRPITS